MKKITRSKVYTLTLVSLMMLSIFQTGRLWFDGISSYNPFSRESVFVNQSSREVSPNFTETYNLTKPQEMMIYLPTKDPNFARISKTTGEYNSLYKSSANIIRSIAIGEQKVLPLDYNLFWEGIQGGLIFHYDYTMDNTVLLDEIFQTKNNIDVDIIDGFNMIYIELIKSANQDSKVYFINTQNEKMVEVKKKIDHKEFNDLFMVAEHNKNILEYIDKQVNIDFAFLSTKKSNKKQFLNNTYLRVPVKSEYYLNNNIQYNNPYILGKKVNEKSFNEYAISFFNHIPQHTNSEDESYYLYWDTTINLKYSTNGLLEYSRAIEDHASSQSKARAFDVAMDFLNKYLSWDEYYLTNYEVTAEGDIIFSFNYSQNDYPIVFKGLETLNILNPIHIKVQNYQVQSARIYMIQQDASSQSKPDLTRTKDYYTDVLNRENISGDINKIELGYTIDIQKEVKPLELNWIIESAEESIVVPIYLVEESYGMG